MGGLPRRDYPTEIPSPRKAHVGFAETLVTGVSRPLTNEEHWALWYFESHAAKCRTCQSPHVVQAEGGLLCDKGFERAYDVSKLLFRLRQDGTVYCRSKLDNQEVRVELPPDYHNVTGLLKAIQRSHNTFLERPKSYDRTYPVLPRISRGGSVRDPREPISPPYNTLTIEPSSPKGRSKPRKPRYDPRRISRGSLYDHDQLAIDDQDRRERMAAYDLAYRNPYHDYYGRRSRAG